MRGDFSGSTGTGLKQALDEILGENGWRSEMRDGSQWILATDRASPPST